MLGPILLTAGMGTLMQRSMKEVNTNSVTIESIEHAGLVGRSLARRIKAKGANVVTKLAHSFNPDFHRAYGMEYIFMYVHLFPEFVGCWQPQWCNKDGNLTMNHPDVLKCLGYGLHILVTPKGEPVVLMVKQTKTTIGYVSIEGKFIFGDF